jgi:hypothetical protein
LGLLGAVIQQQITSLHLACMQLRHGHLQELHAQQAVATFVGSPNTPSALCMCLTDPLHLCVDDSMQEQQPEVEAVASGAIASDYQRLRVEQVQSPEHKAGQGLGSCFVICMHAGCLGRVVNGCSTCSVT